MTSETDKCSISSILPLSCRERAEAFAKRLNSRLQSLGSQDGILINNDSGWLRDNDNPIATSQPKPADADPYYEFALSQSPGEEIDSELTKLISTEDAIPRYNDGDSIILSNMKISNSLDSDSSDAQYFDTESDNQVLFNATEVDSVSSNLVQENNCFIEKTDECANDDSSSSNYSSCNNYVTDDNNKNKLILPELVINNDEDDEIIEIPRVRRCSSLKTGKTPPGTPGQKKIVRFADVLGLDLADVRTYLDEIPKIPTSAYSDLTCEDISSSYSDSSLNSLFGSNIRKNVTKILIPMFQQPGGQPNFLDKVKEKQVCLENVMVEDPVSFAIKGTVRVRNLDYHKSVHVRYTLDSWRSYSDLQATYVQNSCDGFSDKFTFLLYANTLNVGERIEFAVRYQARGVQFWDNNYGINYCFQCLPVSNTSNSTYQQTMPLDDSIGAAFY